MNSKTKLNIFFIFQDENAEQECKVIFWPLITKTFFGQSFKLLRICIPKKKLQLIKNDGPKDLICNPKTSFCHQKYSNPGLMIM